MYTAGRDKNDPRRIWPMVHPATFAEVELCRQKGHVIVARKHDLTCYWHPPGQHAWRLYRQRVTLKMCSRCHEYLEPAVFDLPEDVVMCDECLTVVEDGWVPIKPTCVNHVQLHFPWYYEE